MLFWVCLFCLLTAVGALGSVAFQDELLAATTVLAVMGVLIVSRSFWDTELALVNQRLAAVVGSLWRKPAGGPARGVEVHLQGKAEWEELWGRLTWEASDLHLSTLALDVNVPAKELEQPQVDRTLLSRLASETNALLPDQTQPKLIELATARNDLLKIPSAARSIPLFSDMPLWDAPLALAVFVLLITAEWILRKVFGML